ncbi:MAG: LysR family transcriptional regulator [Bdellovibrionaceae bacterium]|nr:LysR family transcriptional regulator [Pseudobdellovibrionaceae bacterium]
MTIDQLETLEMVVEKGSFKAASEYLHKTQPSLSVAIKKLEAEFDLQLFNRDEYRPKLTAQGKVFYGWAKQCLASFRELQFVGNELGAKKVEPFLTIVLDPLVRFEMLRDLFGEIMTGQYPTQLTFRSEIMHGGFQALLSGDADFAVSYIESEDDRIESVACDHIKMIPVISKSIVRKTANLNSKFLKTIPQIVVSHGARNESQGVLLDSKKCVVTDHSLKRKLIINGLGWGRLALNEVELDLQNGNLLQIQISHIKPFTLDIRMMRLKQKPMGPVARAIWNQVKRKK